MWIILTIVLGVVAHALFFWVIPRIAKANGVNERYFERRLTYSPLQKGTDADRQHAASGELPPLREFARFRSETAAKYVSPVLFPLDVIMMVFLAAFLAVGSVTLAPYVPWAANRTWLLVTVPILYLVFDLAEDSLLAWLLKNPDAISPGPVWLLKFLTLSKFASLFAGYGLLVAVAIAALFRSS
jgi:hypothetical protein